jgi:hypothetical protein
VRGRWIVTDEIEHDKHDAEIDANHSREFYFPPIPWCEDQKQFAAIGLILGFGRKKFGVWQWKSTSGADKVRWSPHGKWREPTATSEIPGHSDAGGRICIVVEPDKVKAFKVDWNR